MNKMVEYSEIKNKKTMMELTSYALREKNKQHQ